MMCTTMLRTMFIVWLLIIKPPVDDLSKFRIFEQVCAALASIWLMQGLWSFAKLVERDEISSKVLRSSSRPPSS